MIRAQSDPDFLYRIRRELFSGSLHLGETVYAPGQHLPAHSHDRPVLILFLQGEAFHTVGGESYRMGPGRAAYVPAPLVHAFTFAGRIGRVFSIELDEPTRRAKLPPYPIHTSDPRLVGDILDAYRTFAHERRLKSDGLQTTLVQSLRRIDAHQRRVRASAAPGTWLAKALAMVSDGATHSVRISAIADEVGKHPSHLSRRFRQVFGESMVEVRERVRVEAASRALLSELWSISTIAADLGFCDHAHLTRSFRRAVRMTPLEFRRVVGDTSLPPELQRNLQSAGAFTFRTPAAADIHLVNSTSVAT